MTRADPFRGAFSYDRPKKWLDPTLPGVPSVLYC